MPWDKLFRQPRRTFLKTAVAAGMLSNTSTVRAQEELFEFGATTQGWQARQPTRLRGAVNPPLDVWGTHEIVWENEDGEPHGLIVEDDAGNIIDQTDVVSTQGATRSVTVSADLTANPPSPARYYCPEHPETMAGTFRVHEYAVYRDGTASVTFTDGESDGSTVTVDSVDFQFTAGFVAIYEGEPFEGLDTEQATQVYGEQSDDLFLGISDSMHMGEHTDVEVPLETPLEAGEQRVLAAIPYVSSERELENSTPYQEPYGYIQIDLATITVGDPSEEIDAEILAFETDGGTVEPGDVVESTVIVENTGDVEHTFFVGYSMFSADGQEFHNDGETGTSVTLEPGEQETVAVTWIVPEDAPTMTYDAVTAVWKESSAAELDTQLDRAENEAAVHVEGTEVELTAAFDIVTDNPIVGQEVKFDASESEAPDGTIVEYRWDFTGDGETDETGEVVEYTFDASGEFEVTLTIVDNEGNEDTEQQTVAVTDADPPEIHAETIEINPIAVETGGESGLIDSITGKDEEQRPTLSAVIENAEKARVTVTVDGEDRDPVDMENRDGDLWETEDEGLPINESPGTRVDLEIETWNNARGEDEAVSQSTFGEEYIQEDDTLGYYIFDEVLEGVLVLGRFSDDTAHDDIGRWARKREMDINTYYGSSRGSMGAVGFNLRIELDNGEAYELDRTRGHYDGLREGFPFIGSRRSRAFMKDLKQKAELELDDEEFWIGTHPGTQLADQTAYYMSSLTLTGQLLDAFRDGFSNPIVYTPMHGLQRYQDGTPVSTDPALGIWYHELAHAYGFEHLHDRGDVGKYCLMHSGDKEDPPEPICSPIRLGLFQEDHADERQDPSWLCERSWDLNNSDLNEPITISYRLTDFVRCDESDSSTTNSQVDAVLIDDIRYIIEARREDPDLGGRSVIVYRQEIDKERDPANRLMQKGFLNEDFRTTIDTVGEDNPAAVKFELAESWTEGTTGELKVEVQLIPGGSTKAVLKDRTSVPDDWKFLSQRRDVTTPNLHLMAEDAAGNVIGKQESEFVNEISGSRTSGVHIGGTEWISVPTDTDVEFWVDSSDVQQFIDDIEARTDEDAIDNEYDLAADCEISVTTYGDEPKIVRENGQVRVADTTTKTIRERIKPGTQQHVEPANDGPCDIVSIHPSDDIAQEYVVFENTGDTILDLSGWTVKSPDGRTYVFPDGFTLEPGATVTLYTGSGTDTESNLYWGEDEPVWEEGDEIILQDSEEETRLNVWYDERQVIYYDEPPEPEEDDDGLFDVDLPEWTPFAGAAGIGLGTAGYLYGRYLRRKDSDDERTE